MQTVDHARIDDAELLRPEQDQAEPLLTVVVCTYNRAELLLECLESLFEQTRESTVFQILVVDNNSDDGTAALVRKLQLEHHNLRLVGEPVQGLSHARNRALHEADSEWVAYLDDDAKANPNWVSQILEIIQTTDFAAFGGPYLPWYRDGKVDWYRDEYGTNLTWMPYTELSELRSDCFSGGNAVFRRGEALAAGGFPIDFGMCGDAISYGEENVLQHRLRERGLRIGFDPQLIIYHLVPMKKQTLDWFCQRKMTDGREYLDLRGIKPSLRVLLGHVLAFVSVDARNLARAFWRVAIRDYRLENAYIAVVPGLLFQREVVKQLLRGIWGTRR